MDIYLQPEHKLPVKAMVALDHAFGRSMRPLPKQNGYRFILNEKYKKNITNFATRLLMMAAGDEQALVTRPAEKVGK